MSKFTVAKALTYSTLAIASETLSLALIFPIMGFIDSDFDLETYRNSSEINQFTFEVFSYAGIPLTLASMMSIALCLITLRQIINYFYSVNLERIKWDTGKQFGARIFSSTMSSRAEYLKNFKGGELTLLSDYESQATATIVRVFVTLWSLTISFLLYFSVMLFASPLPSMMLMTLVIVFSFFTKFLIKQTHELATRNVTERKSSIILLPNVLMDGRK